MLKIQAENHFVLMSKPIHSIFVSSHMFSDGDGDPTDRFVTFEFIEMYQTVGRERIITKFTIFSKICLFHF